MKVREKCAFYISVILYRMTLDMVYFNVLSAEPIFGEYVNTYKADFCNIIISYILILGFALILTHTAFLQKPSCYFLVILFLLTYVPWNSLFACRDMKLIYTLMINIYWAGIFSAFYLIGKRRFKHRKIRLKNVELFLRGNKWILLTFPFFVLIAVAFFYFHYFGGRISLTVTLTDSNALRMAARKYNGGKWILQRLLPWSATIIFPMAFLHYAEKKKYFLAAVFGLGVLLCYSIIGMKQWLFIFIIVLATWTYVKVLKGKKLYFTLSYAFTLLNTLILIVHGVTGNTSIANYTVRRVMYAPCLIGMHHIDYFVGKPKLLLTQCLLGWLRKFGIQLPYENDIGYTIGQLYYSADTNATAGSIADAFENFGVIGLLLYPLVIIISLKFLDSVAGRIKEEYYISILFVYAYSIMSGPLTIAVLSYGFLFALIYLWTINVSGPKEYMMLEKG